MKKWTSVIVRHVEANLKVYILLCGIFIFGLCVGAGIAGAIPTDTCETARQYLGVAIKDMNTHSANVFLSSFLSILKPVLIVWLLGFSRYGIWFINLMLGLKGAFTGFSCGLIIRLYGTKGIALAAAGILPQYIIILPLMLYICQAGIEKSQNIGGGSPLSSKNRTKTLQYALVLLICSAIALLAASVDCYVTSALLRSLNYIV